MDTNYSQCPLKNYCPSLSPTCPSPDLMYHGVDNYKRTFWFSIGQWVLTCILKWTAIFALWRRSLALDHTSSNLCTHTDGRIDSGLQHIGSTYIFSQAWFSTYSTIYNLLSEMALLPLCGTIFWHYNKWWRECTWPLNSSRCHLRLPFHRANPPVPPVLPVNLPASM